MPRFKPAERILQGLNIGESNQTMNTALQLIPSLAGALIAYAKERGIPKQCEQNVFLTDKAATKLQNELGFRWICNADTPVEHLILILKCPGNTHRIAAARRILASQITDGSILLRLCDVMEWSEECREEAAKRIVDECPDQIRDTPAPQVLAKVLMWSNTSEIRSLAASRCILHFKHMYADGVSKSQEEKRRLAMLWVKLWAAQDVIQQQVHLLPPQEPNEGEIIQAIQLFYS